MDKEYTMINNSYDYLVKLPIYTLSQEEIDKLLSTKQELESLRDEEEVICAHITGCAMTITKEVTVKSFPCNKSNEW